MQARFTRHRYELPTLAVFFVIAGIELVAMHLLVSIWSATAAWILSALTLAMLVQIGLLIDGMIRWPTLVDETGVTVRHGRRGEIFVPLAQIAGIDDVAFQPDERRADSFRATLLAQPNLAIRLSQPLVEGRKALRTIRLRLDEPGAFRAAVSARLAAARSGE